MTRASLTLRKPSATSSSAEAIAAFIEGAKDEPEQSISASATIHAAPPAPAATHVATPPMLRAVPAPVTAVPAPVTEPLASLPKEVTPSFRRADRAVVERRTRNSLRRTTVYFDLDVAAELSNVLAERGQQLSNVVNTVMREWLAQQRAR